MSSSIPPTDLASWMLWAIAVSVTTLAGVIATLWKVGESRNAQDIQQAKEEMIAYRTENAGIKAELQTEIRLLREDQKITEAARLKCEMDRARLDATCNLLTTRIDDLEAKNTPSDT